MKAESFEYFSKQCKKEAHEIKRRDQEEIRNNPVESVTAHESIKLQKGKTAICIIWLKSSTKDGIDELLTKVSITERPSISDKIAEWRKEN